MLNRFYDSPADIEVTFFFYSDCRKTPPHDGYRPAHLVLPDLLTSGVHHYYEMDYAPFNENVKGSISFIQPEAYPNSMFLGKVIPIQEGRHIVGYAKVTKIFNPILKNSEHSLQIESQEEDTVCK